MSTLDGASSTDHRRLFALEQDAVRCPYPAFSRLRAEQPVVWVAEIESFVVARYEDVAHVLRHPELYSSALVTGPVLARQTQEGVAKLVDSGDADIHRTLQAVGRGRSQVLLSADPPLHARQRNLVNRAFTQRRVRSFDGAIRSIAEDLVATFPGSGEVELVSAFAVPLPLTVIADRLGVPRSDLDRFKRWSDDFTVAIGNHHMSRDQLHSMLTSQAAFYSYFESLVLERRGQPGEDLVSEIANATLPDGDQLSMPEVLSMVNQFLVAGNETTTKLLAVAAHRLAADAALADHLRAEPPLVEGFVEEVLRLEAPVQGLYRRAVEDCELAGTPIPAGASLWLAYGSANHDDAVFPDPEALDLGRTTRQPHLAFGLGEHFCLGAALARAEARIGITVLLERLGDLRPHERNTYEFEHSYALHGLRELWLRYSLVP